MALRVFEFIINPEDEEMGMKAVSLVENGAIESEYIAFNKTDKPVIFKFKDDKKYIVAGLALIPDKLIYRVDELTGEEYLGYFSTDTIEMIVDKFMKESTNGTLKDVNFQHNPESKVNAHLVESFILRTPEMVNAVKAMGIEEAVLGSWFVSYKFDSQEDYNKAVEGNFTGFSIEVILQRELKMHKNNNKNNDKIMTKVKNFIDKFKTILSEMETTLEDAVVPESGKSLRFGEVGQPVLWVSVDDAGAEVTEPAMEGEYILEDGRTLVVDAQGNLAEVREADTPVAPIPEEEMQKEVIPEVLPEEKLKEVVPEEFPEDEVPPVSGETPTEMVDVTKKTLGELIDVTKDGEYYIAVTVAGGAITEATVEAEQALVKATELAAQKAEVERLKAELEKPVVKSAFVEFSIPRPEEDKDALKGMNTYQRTLHKLGLDK